jgi:hypothetical protein
MILICLLLKYITFQKLRKLLYILELINDHSLCKKCDFLKVLDSFYNV